jgi:hypothetical protein
MGGDVFEDEVLGRLVDSLRGGAGGPRPHDLAPLRGGREILDDLLHPAGHLLTAGQEFHGSLRDIYGMPSR